MQANEVLSNLVGDISCVEVFLSHCSKNVAQCSLMIFEALVPIVLRSTEASKCVKNQPRSHRFPVIFAQGLFPARQAVQKNGVTLFKLDLRKKRPAEIGFARSRNVVAESFAYA